jgi:hypothetical protein
MFDRRALVPFILERGLGIEGHRVSVDSRQRFADIIPDYPSPSAVGSIVRRLRAEVAFMWPGLEVSVDLRDDSTIGDVVQQLAGQLDDWFGD